MQEINSKNCITVYLNTRVHALSHSRFFPIYMAKNEELRDEWSSIADTWIDNIINGRDISREGLLDAVMLRGRWLLIWDAVKDDFAECLRRRVPT